MQYSKLPLFGGLFSWMEAEDINYGWMAALFGVVLVFVGIWAMGLSEGQVFTMLFATAPIWLPYLSFKVFFSKYMEMVGKKFDIKSGRSIFEIVLPPEVFKSPEAMEFVFTQIYNKATPDNLMETYLDGKRPLWYSFELVSKGGDVRFYATIPDKFIYGFRDAMYSQYPGVEIKEVDIDFTAEFPLDGVEKDFAFMSFHMNKKKDSEFPIKTYIEYGLDKFPKEEEKVDPLTPMLEMLGGIRPNQQMWIQFLCKAHREKSFKNGQLYNSDTWEAGVMEKVEEIMQRDQMTDFEGMPRLTPGERETVEIMERNMGKAAFECAIRVVYISKDPSDYDGGLYSRFLRTFAQTEVVKRNGIGMRWRTDYNYMFISDPFRKIIPALKKQELKEFKQRLLYPKTSSMDYKIFTAEELATLFHVPGKVALTPTVHRVQSTRGEAPTNLPTG
jgi:hypothetical protein